MTIDSKTLELALFSMDAYNEGFFEGVKLLGPNEAGKYLDVFYDNTVVSLDELGISKEQQSKWRELGFSAIVYNLGGDYVISYRGTDDPTGYSGSGVSDVRTGYGLGAGGTDAQQALAAIDLYKAVLADTGSKNDITLTGHSMGGGFAGYVAELFGVDAAIFDPMPFVDGAANTYARATAETVTAEGEVISGELADPTFRARIYGTDVPMVPSTSTIKTYYISSYAWHPFTNVLDSVAYRRILPNGTDFELPDDTPLGWSMVNKVGQRHDASLLVIRMMLEPEAKPTGSWTNFARYLFPSLFDETIAEALETRPLKGDGGDVGWVLRNAIAYSGYGTTSHPGPFGTTGMKAFTDDAADAGTAFGLANVSSTLGKAGNALSQMVVQYAGQLALAKVMDDADGDPKSGVLSLDAEKKFLTVDLSTARWNIGASVSVNVRNIVGRNTFIDKVLGGEGSTATTSTARPGMTWLWGTADYSNIGRIVMATTNADASSDLTDFWSKAGLAPLEDQIAAYAGGGGADTVIGTAGDEIIFGGDGTNVIDGGGGKDLLVGGSGDDTFLFRSGSAYVSGGAGSRDKIDFRRSDEFKGTFTQIDGDSDFAAFSLLQKGNEELRFTGIESVVLTGGNDEVSVTGYPKNKNLPAGDSSATLSIDAGAGNGDVLDLSQVEREKYGSLKFIANILARNQNDLKSGVVFKNFEFLKGTSSRDVISGATGFTRISTGGGDDVVTNTKTAAVIDGGAGDDRFDNLATGSIVTLGAGRDKVDISSKQIVVTDASAEDGIYAYGRVRLTGGVYLSGSEDAWAYGSGRLVSYGYDSAGELVIRDRLHNEVLVANGASTNYGSDAVNRAFGLYVFEMSWSSHLLRDSQTPWDVSATFEVILGHYMTAMTGFSGWKGVDPLVLDLDGDGVSLTGRSSVSPRFDVDGDGFAEKTGWVGAHDGLLALDRNGNGTIDDVSELFGGPRAGGGTDLDGDGIVSFDERMQSGFEALGSEDSNGDGVIDASDAVFSDLRVWVDADGDAVTDAGELKTLDEVGIASISLASTQQPSTFLAGNQVTEVGHFTRVDGTTSDVANVALEIDNFDSEWLKQATVTVAAAALPELRGHGTLADLRQVSMLEDARGTDGLHASLTAATPALVGARGLDALRAAAKPVLTAWAAAMPTTGATGGYSSVHVVLGTGEASRKVVDYAYSRKDAQGIEHWVLASRGDPTRGDDPTSFEALMAAHDDLAGRWRVLDAADLSFVERYEGEILPTTLDAGEAAPAMIAAFDMASTHLDMLSLRLAVQLAPEFYGLTYDRARDIFHPASQRQLVPFFEAVFGEVKTADPAEIAARFALMKPVFDRIISAYDRETGNGVNSYGFVYSNIVAAWENVGLPVSLKTAAIDFGIPADMIIEGAGGVVTGTTGDDLFHLGTGDETVTGSNGHDNYIVGRDFGHDTIVDIEPFGTSRTEDYLRFAHAASTDIRADRDGLDLVLTQISTGNSVRVVGEFTGELPGVFGVGNLNDDCGVSLIQFADGVAWTREDIAWKVSHPLAGSDLVTGTPDMDVLDGGAGDDTLVGGNAFDIYVFDRGYGHDTIDERVNSANFAVGGIDQDAVQFGAGIGMDDIAFHRDGGSSDLVLTIAGSDDVLTIHNQFDTTYTGVFGQIWMDRVEVLSFEDGGQIGWEEILTRTLASQETEGDDAIFGFSAADLLDGGAGDDTLSGGNDSDTYVFGYGYGHDVVFDDMSNILAADRDRLSFAQGISLADVTFTYPDFGVDLIASLSDGSSMTLRGEFDATYTGVFGSIAFSRVEYFDFTDADGTMTEYSYKDIEREILARTSTAGDDRIIGFDGDDTLIGGTGDDVIYGVQGDDTYVYARGDGNDTIVEADLKGTWDRLSFSDIRAEDVTLERRGNDLVIHVAESAPGAGDAGSVLVRQTLDWDWHRGVETYVFADGTTWTLDDIRVRLLAPLTTDGDDTIFAFNTDDVLTGGKGDDLLYGSYGNDTYVYARGDGDDTIFEDDLKGIGDRIVFTDIGPEDVTLERRGIDLVIHVAESASGAGDAGSIVVKRTLEWDWDQGVETYVFADGTSWTIADVRARLLGPLGTAGNDTIVGFNTPDVLTGGKGDDLLSGSYGDDTYVYARGDGADTIVEDDLKGTNDRLVFTDIRADDVTLERRGNDLVIDVAESAPGAGDAGSLLVKETLDDDWYRGVEHFDFSDGTTWTIADVRARLLASVETSGNDTVTGFNADDVLAGGRGDDLVYGAKGNDTYVYARGDGNDTIVEYDLGGTFDRIVFSDIRAEDVSLERHFNDLGIRIAESAPGAGDGGSILVKETLDDDWHRGVEIFSFADGTNWTIADVRARLPVPTGTDGDDTLIGGTGDEILRGGAGNDTYIWSRGGGTDIVVEDRSAEANDRLVLTDVSQPEVRLVRTGNDVTLVIPAHAAGVDDGGAVTLTAELEGERGVGVEAIVFADGTTWGVADLRTRLLAQGSTAGNDSIIGFSTDDTIIGGAGDDTSAGGDGNDTYVYARGDGRDTIVEAIWGGDSDRLLLADIEASQVDLYRRDNDLLVWVGETAAGRGDGGSIRLKNTLVPERGLGVDQIVFADGTTWAYADFVSHLARVSIPGFEVTDPDTFVFGSGNERLVGNGHACTYVYWSEGGNGEVDDGGGSSRLWFYDIASTDLSIARDGRTDDLVFTIASIGKTVRVHNQFSAWSEGTLATFSFSDGVVWTANDVKRQILAQATAQAGADVIGYRRSDDVLEAGLGDRYLAGYGGADTYVYASAGGNDVIDDGGSTSRLVFSDIASTGVSIERVGRSDDLKVTIGSTGRTVLIRNQFSGWSEGTLATLAFADGVVWTADEIKRKILAQATAGEGTDVIGFYRSEDVLEAGRGDRTLFGGGGGFVDTYVYSSIGGNIVVDDGGGRSRLAFSDIASWEVSFEKVAGTDDLVFTVASTGKTVTVRNQFSVWGEGTLVDFTFADGVSWTASDVRSRLLAITGTAGDDTLVGSAGSDTVIGGAGNDLIDGGDGLDTALFSGHRADYAVSLVGGVPTVRDGHGGRDGVDRLVNVERLAFADGTLGLTAAADGRVTLTASDGRVVSILYTDGRADTYGADGKVASITYADGRVASYARNADGSYKIHWTGASGQYTSYDAAYGTTGKLASITFPDGRVDTYGADGKTASVAFADGRVASYARNADGSYMIHWTGIAGRYASYDAAYGTTGTLASITYPDGRVDTYGADGKVASIAYAGGLVASYARNADGSYMIHWTGIAGRYASYDAAYGTTGTLASITYPDGRVDTYGADGKVASIAYAGGLVASYARNADGSYMIHWTGASGQYASYDAAYGTTGRLASITFPDGRVDTYGADGKVASVAYADGRVATYGRNADGSFEVETRNIVSSSWDTAQVFYGTNGKVLSEVYSKAGVAVRVVNRDTDGALVEATALTGTPTSTTPFGGRSSIDLRAFDVATTTLGFTEDASNTFGRLTLTRGNEQLALTLFGQYTASSFAMAADGHGGLMLSRQLEPAPLLGG